MIKTILTYAGTIQEIQNRNDLILITDSQEVETVLNDLNYPSSDEEAPMDFGGLFVALQDGDYSDILAYEGTIPYLYKDLWKIDTKFIPYN